ncbi:hypothetical protein [Hyphomicrobium sp. DY-1]|uniref:hypothetical protein n=1 Tax=Hyphomicrobium sp. DY-1 TaxID=3075650 RepID=UPI0039C1BC9B
MLADMHLHNPRNPFPPTDQDLFEAANTVNDRWQYWVKDFYFSGQWAKAPNNVEKPDIARHRRAAIAGGKPGEPGCIVPFDLCLHYLSEEIDRQLPDIADSERRARQGYGVPSLLAIKDEVLERMPEAAFSDGALTKIRSIRAARAEAARKAEEHEAYLKSLPDEVRSVRWTVLDSDQWKDAPESAVMAETNRRIERIKEGRAEAEANGGEFAGCCFDDGTEWRESWRRSIWRA